MNSNGGSKEDMENNESERRGDDRAYFSTTRYS